MSYDESNGLAGFIARLNWVWNQAGRPSCAQLETVSGQLAQDNREREVQLEVLAHSTTHQILAGKRRSVPRWPWVLSFVTALQVVARRTGIPSESIGTIDEWRQRHAAVSEATCRGPVGVGDRRGISAAEEAGHSQSLAIMTPPDHGFDRDELLGEFLQLLRRAGAPQWWDEYVDVASDDLRFHLSLESNATRIRMYAPGLVPALLQTEAYASAVVSRWKPDATAAEIARHVELRPRRQRRLEEPDACQLWAMVEESALRPRWVSRAVMREQIRHLIEMVDHPKVAIGVRRSTAADADIEDDNVTIKEPVGVFRFAQQYLGDVVSIEQPDNDVLFLYKWRNTAHYNQLMDILTIRTSEKTRDVQDRLRGLLRDT